MCPAEEETELVPVRRAHLSSYSVPAQQGSDLHHSVLYG